MANKVCARKSHDTAIDGTQKVGGRPGQELRFAIPSAPSGDPRGGACLVGPQKNGLNRQLVANDDLSAV